MRMRLDNLNLAASALAMTSLLFVANVFGDESGSPENKQASGVTPTEIRVGQSLPLTGPSAIRAKELLAGSKLYFDKINKAGGINGRKITLISKDDMYEPEKTVENVRGLIQNEGIFALFGVFGTPSSKALLPLVEKHDIPFFFPMTGADILFRPPIRNVYGIKAPYSDEAETLLKFLVETKKIKEIGLLYQDDAFGSAARGAVQKVLMTKYGLKLKTDAPYTRNAEHAREALMTIQKGNPKAVLLFTTGPAGLEFIRAAAAADFKPLFALSEVSVTADFPKETSDLKLDIYATRSFPPFEDKDKFSLLTRYLADVKAAGTQPTAGGIVGYANAIVFAEVLKRMGNDVTRSSFIKTIDKLIDFDLGGIKVTFSPDDHVGVKEPFLFQVKNGGFKPL